MYWCSYYSIVAGDGCSCKILALKVMCSCIDVIISWNTGKHAVFVFLPQGQCLILTNLYVKMIISTSCTGSMISTTYYLTILLLKCVSFLYVGCSSSILVSAMWIKTLSDNSFPTSSMGYCVYGAEDRAVMGTGFVMYAFPVRKCWVRSSAPVLHSMKHHLQIKFFL